VIFHSGHGCQYTSGEFAELASDYQVALSPGRTCQCWDNALAESFFASPKGEQVAGSRCPAGHQPAFQDGNATDTFANDPASVKALNDAERYPPGG
jgi:transposase InsO family protein